LAVVFNSAKKEKERTTKTQRAPEVGAKKSEPQRRREREEVREKNAIRERLNSL
jgi:hypothetical protein